MGHILLIAICSLLMLAGFLGIFLPFVPGVPLVWLGILIYAAVTGFETISIPVVIIFFVLTAFTLVLDLAGPLLGLKKYRASGWSILGSFLGFILGLIFFNIWGVILGPILGAFIAEVLARRNLQEGLRAGIGALFGWLIGTLIRVVIALIMIGYFIYSFF